MSAPIRFSGAAFLALAVLPLLLRADLVPAFRQTVFKGGAEGPETKPHYRIPTIAQTADGALLAFAEGRQTPADPGSGFPISMNCKLSEDNGRTWGAIQVLARDSAYSYSDPRAVVDRRRHRVFIFYTRWPVAKGARSVGPGTGDDSSVLFCRMSEDDGRTWAAPIDLNPRLKSPAWRALNSIVGIGIQLRRQTREEGGADGRLIFPACATSGEGVRRDVSIYSDDGGQTWRISPAMTPNEGASESDMTELPDGRLLLSARNDGPPPATRYHYWSRDGGLSWILAAPVEIPVTRVDCGLTFASGRVLISAPLGTPVGSGRGRSNLGVWVSQDGGATFPRYRQLVSGFSGYSQIIELNDRTLGLIYEATHDSEIVFLNFPVQAISSAMR